MKIYAVAFVLVGVLIPVASFADDQALSRHYNELQSAITTANSAFADLTADLKLQLHQVAADEATIKKLQGDLDAAKAQLAASKKQQAGSSQQAKELAATKAQLQNLRQQLGALKASTKPAPPAKH